METKKYIEKYKCGCIIDNRSLDFINKCEKCKKDYEVWYNTQLEKLKIEEVR